MTRQTLDRILALLASVVVVGAVVAAIVQNPPSVQRNRAIDSHRSRDLMSAQNRIDQYYRKNEKLPESLAVLCEQCVTDYKDPETGVPYGYEKTGDRTYRLCADFATDNRADPRSVFMADNMDYRHSAGHKCYDLTASNRNGF